MRPKAALPTRLFRLLASIGLVMLFAGSAAASQIGFVYALLQGDGSTNQIYGFRFDLSTGALTLLPSFPVASGGTGTPDSAPAEQLAYFDGRLYVLNDGDNTMTAFSVNRSTGALTAMPFNPVSLGTGSWVCVAVHPSGSPVVVGNGSSGISSFVVTDTTATPAPGSPYITGIATASFSCRFSQDGTYVYTGGGASSTRMAGFSVNAVTGMLTALLGSPFNMGGFFPMGYATDGSGRLFSVMNTTAQVRAYTTVSGVPTGVSGNPFASGLSGGVHGILHPGGFYLAADRFSNLVGSYQIGGTGAGTTLTAASGSPFAAGGTNLTALALTPDGVHLVAANGTSRNLTVFQVNASTGALTSVGVQAANTLGASGRVTGLAFGPVVPPFTDDPLTALTSVIKAVHITELRTRINAVRAQHGQGPYSYTDPTLTVATTVVQAVHVNDLRTALAEVYTALGMPQPSYTDPSLTIGSTVVKVAHIAELRAAVAAIE